MTDNKQNKTEQQQISTNRQLPPTNTTTPMPKIKPKENEKKTGQ